MNQTDDRILEILNESELVLSTVVIAANLDYSRSWVSQRLSKLRDAGLVDKSNNGLYQITDRGRAYPTGDLNADDLENPDA